MLNLDYRDTRPIYAQIVDNIRQQIQAGVMAQDEKLPSVRELAVRLSINPNTIQRAYRQLEMEGWIATVPGKGCFVCGKPQEHLSREAHLLASFDNAARQLLAVGYTTAQLIRRLEQEEYHA